VEHIQELFRQVMTMQWSDYLDIIIVAFLLYRLFLMVRTTGTMRVAATVVAIIIFASLTELLKLHALNFIFDQFIQVGLIAVVVLFQPELRRMLEQLGSVKLSRLLNPVKATQEMIPIIQQTVAACEVMSRERVGALIVFARNNRLEEQLKTGTMINGQISDQLIRNIFFPKASLHDGAVIIRDGKVTAAGCVLPLSDSVRLSADLGTRHKAALGMSEVSDAVVVVVSEETGTISVAVGGMMKRHLASQTLERLLTNELCPEDETGDEKLVVRLKQKLKRKSKGERK